MIKYINNIISSLKDENISIKKFINELLEHKKEISYELLDRILMNIYYKCGYNAYRYKFFEQTLK